MYGVFSRFRFFIYHVHTRYAVYSVECAVWSMFMYTKY